MKSLLLSLFFLSIFVFTGYGQSEYSKELYDQFRNGESENLKKLLPAQPGKVESDTTLFVRYLVTDDGEKAVLYLEQLVERYPRSEFAVASYAGMYLYYLAIDNFRKANNCVLAVENEFPGESISYFIDESLPHEGEGIE